MTNEEMDRAIAEYVGTADRWLIVKRGYFYRPNGHGYTSCVSEACELPLSEAKKHEYLIGEEPVTLRKAPIPAYSTDLNAMRDARAALRTATQKTNFVVHLHRIVAPDPLRKDHPWDLIDAKPEQQAQAFLRTIGKYSDATHPLP